jgi:hypothetical protein
MTDHEQRIRSCAYRIWEEEGRPEGRADIHWNMASELVAEEDNPERTEKPEPLLGGPIEEATTATGGEVPARAGNGEQKNPPLRETVEKKIPRPPGGRSRGG